MRMAFLSNKMTAHQLPLSNELYNLLGEGYRFVETMDIDNGDLPMGWKNTETPQYLISYQGFHDNHDDIQRLIDESDVVVYGSAPFELVKERLRQGKLVFRYSERIFKQEESAVKMLLRRHKYKSMYGSFESHYLLCASAYACADYYRAGVFKNKAYEWGYFPQTFFDNSDIIEKKQKRELLWCGRMIDWKYPGHAVILAERLKKEGVSFKLIIAGTGNEEEKIRNMAKQFELDDCVEFFGEIPPIKVRELMDRAGIFLFTSDRQEGWGAVLNEAMGSGCAVVASHAIGSVPSLIKDGENGMIYRSGDTDMLYEKTRMLVDDPALQSKTGKNALLTIHSIWNEKVAADRLLRLSERILAGEKSPELYTDGPCSKAKMLPDNWF